MKTIIKQTTFILLISVSLIAGCKKDDDTQTNNVTTSSILTAGSWRVNYFHEDSSDHTSNFTGYTFIFNSNGTMTATNSAGTTNGTWSNDDSQNELHISLGNNDPLKDLSKGWLIISKTSSEIKLKDDNTAHNEELHFIKI